MMAADGKGSFGKVLYVRWRKRQTGRQCCNEEVTEASTQPSSSSTVPCHFCKIGSQPNIPRKPPDLHPCFTSHHERTKCLPDG